ncbi:hypothetical protein BDW59DRAFT_156634 [Aspergillus cavernicola]|uniref:NB-ARC domain-containing protein n=1 Tax=Aspergillus cavernicola TaxID=176166 RepID=A0ABR4J1E2_9EURO
MHGSAPQEQPGNEFITERWQDALRACEKDLGREDFEYIMEYNSPEELVKEIDNMIKKVRDNSVPRLLRQMKPYVGQIKTFAVLCVSNLTSLQSVCIWGLILLMLQLAERSEDFLSSITEMWADISNSLEVFKTYDKQIKEDQELGVILFEILEELQKFAVCTITNLKSMGPLNYNHQIDRCKSQFATTSRNISNRIQTIKDKILAKRLMPDHQGPRAEAIDLIRPDQTAETLSMGDLSMEEARLPCFYVPFTANPVFLGRKGILDDIEPASSSMSDCYGRTMPSVALWGIAGIGKTQIALEYAYRKRKEGVQAIFWIDTERESEYTKAFTEIAAVLNLQGATSSKGHDTNRLLVLRWLQETSVPWLLIFDNVEDNRVLSVLWPSNGPGSVLITCRSELIAVSSPAAQAIEIPAFTDDEGSRLLLKEIGVASETAREKGLSVEFAGLLGGHALSLNVMARSIVARKKGLEYFVQVYKKNPHSLHKKPKRKTARISNQYYRSDDDLESLWAIPFSELDEEASRTLGIMSMCGPNKIPDIIFKTATFGTDEEEFDEITLFLRSLALIGTNHNSTKYSVHRLIQYEYRNYIGDEEEAERWKDAMTMIREVFPRQHKGFTMFNQWEVCESLIEHVESIARRYRSLAERVKLDYSEEFTYLLADASRYLAEIGRYNACVELVDDGFHHCTDTESIPYTNLCVTMGHVLCERGQDMTALKYNDIVLRVREAHLDPMHSEIANAMSNSALSMVGCGKDVEEALTMLKRSLAIDLQNPPEDHGRVLHLRHFNTAFALQALGRIEEARSHVDRASACAEAEFGKDSRYLTISHRMYADFAIREQRYAEAYGHALRSLAIAKLGDSATPWVAAALFYLGDISLKQGNPAEAIGFLKQARTISQINEREKKDKGEYVRVLNKLAQAHEASGDADRGHKMREEADATYKTLIQTGEYTESDDERLKWDYLICLKFR